MRHAWPLGYSGYGGVSSSGVHFGSATVAGLPSVFASWMAVIGRQKAKSYLARQQEMAASARGRVEDRERAGAAHDVEAVSLHEVPDARLVLDRRVVAPEQRVLGLLGCACRARQRPEVVDLLEVARVAPTVKGIRAVQRDLRLGAQHQRPDEAHPDHGKRRQGRRRGPPHSDARSARVRDRRVAAAVTLAQQHDARRGGLPDGDALVLGAAIGDPCQRGLIVARQFGGELREVGGEDAVGRGGRRRLR